MRSGNNQEDVCLPQYVIPCVLQATGNAWIRLQKVGELIYKQSESLATSYRSNLLPSLCPGCIREIIRCRGERIDEIVDRLRKGPQLIHA